MEINAERRLRYLEQLGVLTPRTAGERGSLPLQLQGEDEDANKQARRTRGGDEPPWMEAERADGRAQASRFLSTVACARALSSAIQSNMMGFWIS